MDLKKGEFKPEYAGKMNFYCSAVDDLLRQFRERYGERVADRACEAGRFVSLSSASMGGEK